MLINSRFSAFISSSARPVPRATHASGSSATELAGDIIEKGILLTGPRIRVPLGSDTPLGGTLL